MTTDARGYWDKESILEQWNTLLATYPTKVSRTTIGYSYPISYNGGVTEPIYLYKVGNLSAPSAVLIDGCMHGREFGSAEVMYYFALWLCTDGAGHSAYEQTIATDLADDYQYWFVPIVNPGGHTAMWDDASADKYPQVKNASGTLVNFTFSGYGQGRYNGNNMDLNRSTANSAPERTALRSVWQNNSVVRAFISQHCGSNNAAEINSSGTLKDESDAIAGSMGVATYSSWSLSTSGSTGNYMHQYCFNDRGIPSIMLEINGQWRDPVNDIYPRPPVKSTYFLTQVTSGTYNGYPANSYYYKKAWAVYIAVAQSLPPATNPVVYRTVTFNVSSSGLPVSSATVSFGSQVGTTNASGIVAFQVEAGTYAYSVVKSGYVTDSGSQLVGSVDVSVSITLTLVPSGEKTITVTVTDASSALPIEYAIVTIGAYSDATDASGVATILVNDGTYALSISKNGYGSSSESYVVSANASLSRTLTATYVPPSTGMRVGIRSTGVRT